MGRTHIHFRMCLVVAHGKDTYTLQDMLGGAAVMISSLWVRGSGSRLAGEVSTLR